MHVDKLFALRAQSHRKLAIVVASALGLGSNFAAASTFFVSNCLDSGAGSLRSSVGLAASGDTVDMSWLTPTNAGCSTSSITLTTGAIAAHQQALTLKGPVAGIVVGGAATNSELDRIINHSGTGVLSLSNITLKKGELYLQTGNAIGGCLRSSGSVVMTDGGATECFAYTKQGMAAGGAIYAKGGLVMTRSTVTYSSAESKNGFAVGGGVYVSGHQFVAKYSAINDNTTWTPNPLESYAGGIFSDALSVYLKATSIVGNGTGYFGGGAVLKAASSIMIANSTVGHNFATYGAAGLITASPSTTLLNSTVALNQTRHTAAAAGMASYAGTGPSTLNLRSTLIANNRYGTWSPGPTVDSDLVTHNLTVTGSHNLVYQSSAPLPADTIVATCPLLGPVATNGGNTSTIALDIHSPAIDAGSVPNSPALPYDQRGSPYQRKVGGAPDIGAFERQPGDMNPMTTDHCN